MLGRVLWRRDKRMDKTSKTDLAVMFFERYALAAYTDEYGSVRVLDVTGGYGDVKIPVTVCWLQEEKRFLAGYEALLTMPDEGLIIEHVMDVFRLNQHVSLDGRKYDGHALLCVFLSYILSHMRDINPRAEYGRLVLKLPQGISLDEKALRAIESKVHGVGQLTVSQCSELSMLSVFGRMANEENQPFNVLNMAYEGYQGWIYDKEKKCMTEVSHVDDFPTMMSVEKSLVLYLRDKYAKKMDKVALEDKEIAMIRGIAVSSLQNIFVRYFGGKSLRVTFNQVFPPFQITLGYDELSGLVKPFIDGLTQLMAVWQEDTNGLPVLVSGSLLNYRWMSGMIKEGPLTIKSAKWDGLLEALIKCELKEEVKTPYPLGIMVQDAGGETFYEVIAAGTSVDLACQTVLLVLTNQDKKVAVLEARGSSNYHEVACKEIELDDEVRCVEVLIRLDRQGKVQIGITEVPL